MITESPIRAEDYAPEDKTHACGAVVTFKGVVRSQNDGREVMSIFYDCYRKMAEKEMRRIVDGALASGDIGFAHAVHRVGQVAVGEVSLVVVVAAPHRKAAFAAAQRIIDDIKTQVPVWKKEQYADQTSRWR